MPSQHVAAPKAAAAPVVGQAAAKAALEPRQTAASRDTTGPDTETDSDDELRPYDLSEGEDDGAHFQPARARKYVIAEHQARLQLRGVAATPRESDDISGLRERSLDTF